MKLREFKKSYNNLENGIIRIAGEKSYSKIIRLNYFKGNREVVNYLKSQGVKQLLTADDDRLSYILTKEQMIELKGKDFIEVGGIKYIKTDIRLEKKGMVEKKLYRHKDEKILVVFTHEWAAKKETFDLLRCIFYLWLKGYKFSN